MDQEYSFDLNQLDLLDKIGEGPHAEVFQAKDKKTGLISSAKFFEHL